MLQNILSHNVHMKLLWNRDVTGSGFQVKRATKNSFDLNLTEHVFNL